jgi:hypothetical protein
MVFLSCSRCLDIAWNLDHDRFHLQPFHPVIHYCPFTRHCALWTTEGIVRIKYRHKEDNQTTVEAFFAVFCHRISTEIHLVETQISTDAGTHPRFQRLNNFSVPFLRIIWLVQTGTTLNLPEFRAAIFVNTRMAHTGETKVVPALN